MKKKTTQNYQKAFTVVELIMATAVFSVVLLLGLTGFIQIGKMFYKGVTLSQTRDASSNVLQTVTNDIKLASDTARPVPNMSNAICIGNHRYSYQIGRKLTALDGGSPSQYALKRETFNNPGECMNSSISPSSTSASTELLQNNMRLAKFSVSQIGATNLHSVNIKVIYGDDDDLTTTSDYNAAQCKASPVGTEYCAVSELSTIVYRGLGSN